MKYFVFDECMDEEYEFDTEADVKAFLQEILDDLDPEDHEGALEEIRIIKGERVAVDL